MAVLGTMFAGSYLAMGGGSKPKSAAGPPINASSKEEGDFIQYVPAIYPNIPDETDDTYNHFISHKPELVKNFPC